MAAANTDRAFAEAERLTASSACGDCGAPLATRWLGDTYRAVCTRDATHEHVVTHADIEREATRQRIEQHPRLSQALAIQGARVPLTSQAIAELDNQKLLARVPDRYGQTIEVSPQQKLQLAQIARLYQLDPLWDLMVYEGRPYVTYEGRLRKLREAPGYQGHRVRPLSRQEKEDWGYDPQDLVIQCDVNMGSHGVVTDWGVVRAEEIASALETQRRNNSRKPAPVASHPQQIALKRAIARASRQAVGIDLPTWDGGQTIEAVREVPAERAQLGPGDPDARARRRFWAIAKGGSPDGLGLAEAEIHQLLGVETLRDYPGGWDQALSDLTEAAANRQAAAVDEDVEEDELEELPDFDDVPLDQAEDLPAADLAEIAERLANGEALTREELVPYVRALEREASELGLQVPVVAESVAPTVLARHAARLRQRIRDRNLELDRQLANEQGAF